MDENEITLRDRFAMAAIPGLVHLDFLDAKEAARRAYDVADAMLLERSGEAQAKRDADKAQQVRWCEMRERLRDAGWKSGGDDQWHKGDGPWLDLEEAAAAVGVSS